MTDLVWVAVITGGLGFLGSLINGYFMLKAKKLGNNPHPCRDHADMLKELDDKIEILGKEQARQGQNLIDNGKRLDRIEGKLNGVRR